MALLIAESIEDHRVLLQALLMQEGLQNMVVAASVDEALAWVLDPAGAADLYGPQDAVADELWRDWGSSAGQGRGDASKSGSASGVVEATESGPEFGPVDAVILGSTLGRDGVIRFCRQVRAKFSHEALPVIVVSPDDGVEFKQAVYTAGASEFVRKPYDRVELLARVRSALRMRAVHDQNQRRYASIRETSEHLEQSLVQYEQDLAAAAEVQRSLLPDLRSFGDQIRAGASYVPSSGVGGDLYGLVRIDERYLAFYLLDVAGHGVQAALLCIGLHRFLSVKEVGGLLLADDGTPRAPREVCGLLNREVHMLSQTLKYFTLCYGVIDLQQRTLTMSQAGHPPALFGVPGKPIEAVQGGDAPIGLLDFMEFTDQSFDLPYGARLILYSDGILDSGVADQHRFGLERLIESANRHRDETPEDSAAAILGESLLHAMGGAAKDDMTILVLDIPDNF